MSQPITLYTASKVADKLDFLDPPPGEVAYIEHDFKAYRLEGRILYNQKHEWPWVLSIHGARADYTGSNPTSFTLQQHGLSLLGFNLSGHNPTSAATLTETTPRQNIGEALTFYNDLDDSKPRALIAYSFGCVPALNILRDHLDQIDRLVLVGPAVYSIDTYDKNFVPDVQPILRTPFSYRNNDVIEPLRRFKGRVLLVKGQYDGLDPLEWGKPAGTAAGEIVVKDTSYYSPIPKEVIDMIYNAVAQDKREFLEVPLCGHSINSWARQHPDKAVPVLKQIADFMLRE